MQRKFRILQQIRLKSRRCRLWERRAILAPQGAGTGYQVFSDDRRNVTLEAREISHLRNPAQKDKCPLHVKGNRFHLRKVVH